MERQASRGRPLASHLSMAGIAMVFVGEPEECPCGLVADKAGMMGMKVGARGHQTISILPLDALLLPVPPLNIGM